MVAAPVAHRRDAERREAAEATAEELRAEIEIEIGDAQEEAAPPSRQTQALMRRYRETLSTLPQDVMEGSEGVQLSTRGGLTIKRNDFRNLYGALGEVMLIPGKFSVSPKRD